MLKYGFKPTLRMKKKRGSSPLYQFRLSNSEEIISLGHGIGVKASFFSEDSLAGASLAFDDSALSPDLLLQYCTRS